MNICAMLYAEPSGDVRRARELAALARQAFIEQPGLSQYFKKSLAELQKRLKMVSRE